MKREARFIPFCFIIVWCDFLTFTTPKLPLMCLLLISQMCVQRVGVRTGHSFRAVPRIDLFWRAQRFFIPVYDPSIFEMSFQTINRIIVILVGDLIPKRHMLFLDPHQIGEPHRLHVFESSFFHVSPGLIQRHPFRVG